MALLRTSYRGVGVEALAEVELANFSPDLPHVTCALVDRMGTAPDDRRLQMVAAVWGAIMMAALADLGPGVDWGTMTADGIVSRLEVAYAQFLDVTADVKQLV